jgi:hypothetical protein
MADARCESQKLIECSLEIIRRIQVVLKQKLNGAFTRLASHTHGEKDGGEMPREERKFSSPLSIRMAEK